MTGEGSWSTGQADAGGGVTDGRREVVQPGDRDDQRARAEPAHGRTQHRGRGGQWRPGDAGDGVRRFGISEEPDGDVPVLWWYPTHSRRVGPGQRTQALHDRSGRPHGDEESRHPASVALGRTIRLTSGARLST